MIETFFSQEQKDQIAQAIAEAEKETSGEIRVHIDKNCTEEVLDRAAFVFAKLNMHKTVLRNGVLIYISVNDKKLAIIGDLGINKVVPADFWEEIKTDLVENFKKQEFTKGICAAIHKAGRQLKAHFPLGTDDKNELSDDISFGNKNM